MSGNDALYCVMQIGEDCKEKKVKMVKEEEVEEEEEEEKGYGGQVRFSRERNAHYSTLLSIYSILNLT